MGKDTEATTEYKERDICIELVVDVVGYIAMVRDAM